MDRAVRSFRVRLFGRNLFEIDRQEEVDMGSPDEAVPVRRFGFSVPDDVEDEFYGEE